MNESINRKAMAWTFGMTLVVYAMRWGAAGPPVSGLLARVTSSAWAGIADLCEP